MKMREFIFSILGFLLISNLAIGSDILSYVFGPNDGPSILCSYFNLELLHPGLVKALACTYDHQPLYFYILKILRVISSNNLTLIRYFHLFIWIGTIQFFYYMCRKRGNGVFSSFIVSSYLLTSPLFIHQALQMRMYIIYLLIVLVLFWHRERKSSDNITFRTISILGYFNFLFTIIPVAVWDLIDIVKNKGKNIFNKLGWNSPLLILLSIKIYYLYYHRFVRRGAGLWYHSHDIWRHISDIMLQVIGWPEAQTPFLIHYIIGTIIFLTVVIFMALEYRKGFKKNRESILFCLISYIFILIIRFGFRIDEVETRYILYLTPIILLICLDFVRRNRQPVKYFALSLVLISIISNFYWIRNYFKTGAAFNTHRDVRELISNYNPPFIYTFDEYHIANYIMAYQKFLYDIYVPILEIHEFTSHYYLHGITYGLIENSPIAQKRLDSMVEKGSLISYESLGCFQFGHPNVCFYKLQGSHQFDHLSEDQINKMLVPWDRR